MPTTTSRGIEAVEEEHRSPRGGRGCVDVDDNVGVGRWREAEREGGGDLREEADLEEAIACG